MLEIGAGTGIFTLPIARHCREVVAVDISGGMLEVLKRKAAKERLANIRTLVGNAETMDLGGRYSLACAFSSLYYLADLPAFFKRLARHLEPGGTLYFITARRSLFGVFTQIGNAARQGMWLKAHSRARNRSHARGRRLRGDPDLLPPAQIPGFRRHAAGGGRPAGAAGACGREPP